MSSNAAAQASDFKRSRARERLQERGDHDQSETLLRQLHFTHFVSRVFCFSLKQCVFVIKGWTVRECVSAFGWM